MAVHDGLPDAIPWQDAAETFAILGPLANTLTLDQLVRAEARLSGVDQSTIRLRLERPRILAGIARLNAMYGEDGS